MRKTALLLVVTTFLAAPFGCGSSGASAAVLESSDGLLVIEAEADGGSLQDALNALSESGEISIEGTDGEYGLYITSVNGRSADSAANEYWAIYTTLGELDGVSYSSGEYGSFDYDGKTLSSALYGAGGLIMAKGELYALKLETY